MTIQQLFVAFCCLLLATQQITAVVNTAKNVNLEETTSKNVSSTGTNAADSVHAGTEQEAKRREAPALGDSYGLPLIGGGGLDSYVPSGPSNPSLPIPVYGVPDAPTKNIIYPAPPPDIPPPLPSYGVPSLPSQTYGVPHFESHLSNFIPPPPPKYLPPIKSHKPFHVPFHSKPSRPRPYYGPPHKPNFAPKFPKPTYGPPKQVYGPPKAPLFVPQKHIKQQVTVVTLPNINNHVPLDAYGPPHHFGPPEPVPHGPPHPGIPAPPTPPDIKYDGWQPIPGLVSRPPSDSYGVPEGEHHGNEDLQLNSDFTPPPADSGSHSLNIGYVPPPQGVSDSYGAPLNAVTGSGSIDTASGDSHHDDQSLSLGLSAAGINNHNQLSVIKSIGYELFPDSYSSPPASSYSPNGPYAAAHSYKSNGLSSFSSSSSSLKFQGGLSAPTIGLIPPSGVYGAPPSSQYGTPLLTKPTQYTAPLNALHINPPKRPIIFREPVPAGLIESIGHNTAHKDAHGIIDSSHHSGPTYIPPPVPEVSKPVKEEPPLPSHLYSLPNPTSSVSFQSGIINGFDGGHGQTLTSYTAPLGAVDGSYGLPLHSSGRYSFGLDSTHSGGLTVGLDHSHPPVSIDLTGATSNLGHQFAQIPPGYAYDCKHGSQPLPSLSYGVPAANSYTAALSSLTTNIGGSYQPDLEIQHSQKVSTTVSADNSQGKAYGKSLAQKFGPDSELVKSESVDVNNIPLKGNLGSYTLQIQSADGLSDTGEQVSHTQVLNGGLLESILAAIEQPDKKDTKILGRPISHLYPADDKESQNVNTPSTATPEVESETDPSLHLIDDNGIALYFNNSDDKIDNDEVRNGQQYGSFVSFKSPETNFKYEFSGEKSPDTKKKD